MLLITLFFHVIGVAWALRNVQDVKLSSQQEWPDLWPRIMVHYINLEKSTGRKVCMEDQLNKLRADARKLSGEVDWMRIDAVDMGKCTDEVSCMQQYPQCFPVGKIAHQTSTHRGTKDKSQVFRGVIGNWCSHLRSFDAIQAQIDNYDYFLVLEDDTVFKDTFIASLFDFLKVFPRYWSLAAIDTFNIPDGEFPAADQISDGIYSIAGDHQKFWGAQAWLLNAPRFTRFQTFYRSLPALAVDWIPKAPHPLHVGMWAVQLNAVRQFERLKDSEKFWLSSRCMDVSKSDISGTVFKAGSLVHNNAVALLQSQQTNVQFASNADGDIDQHVNTTHQFRGREVILLGMHGTSSSLSSLLMALRNRLGSPPVTSRCENTKDGIYCGNVWMHTHPKRLWDLASLRNCTDKKCQKMGDLKEAIGVIVVQHPYRFARWLEVHKDQHDMNCGNATGAAALKHACEYNMRRVQEMEMPKLAKAPCPTTEGGCWVNRVQAWNEYIEGAKALQSLELFHNVVILRDEDIQDSVRDAVARISRAVSVPPKSLPGEYIKDSAPELSLSSPDYGMNFHCDELIAMCKLLQLPKVYSLGYHACQPAWPGYKELIFGTPDNPLVTSEVETLKHVPLKLDCRK